MEGCRVGYGVRPPVFFTALLLSLLVGYGGAQPPAAPAIRSFAVVSGGSDLVCLSNHLTSSKMEPPTPLIAVAIKPHS